MGGNYFFPWTGVHEVLGAVLFVLWGVHVALNRRWHASLAKGAYRPFRIVQAVVNCGILACALFLMISGIMISQHVFAFLGISGGANFARKAHMLASHWYFFVYVAAHRTARRHDQPEGSGKIEADYSRKSSGRRTKSRRSAGLYGLWQCSVPCHDKTYDNEAAVRKMVETQKDMRIPSSLIPYCPRCGKPMSMNLRSDSTFVEDEGWHKASERYGDFIATHKNEKILLLELGVGSNTPSIIKYPFWRMCADNPRSVYACINYGEALCPDEIRERSICIDGDIANVLNALEKM